MTSDLTHSPPESQVGTPFRTLSRASSADRASQPPHMERPRQSLPSPYAVVFFFSLPDSLRSYNMHLFAYYFSPSPNIKGKLPERKDPPGPLLGLSTASNACHGTAAQ